MNSSKTILFDFDGTIADTMGAGVAVFNVMAEEYGFGKITDENSEYLRGKGPREVMKELSIPALRVPMVIRRLRSGLKEQISTLPPQPGIKTMLIEIKNRGYRLGIVTTNSNVNVLAFLKRHDIDFFDYIHAGSGVFRKTFAIRRMMFRHRLKKVDVIFVGDEIRDIDAARKMKIPVIAVTWGINSKEGLLRAEPEFIVDTTEELLKILA